MDHQHRVCARLYYNTKLFVIMCSSVYVSEYNRNRRLDAQFLLGKNALNILQSNGGGIET